MNKPKIDLLKQKYDLDASREKSFLFFVRIAVAVIVIAGTVGIAFSYRVGSTTENSNFPRLSLFSTLSHFIQADDRGLDGEKEDRVNFLLMGIGGEGHEGPQLTDTMIFASYQPSSGDVGIMSLPRDMTVPIPGHGYRKVNHANAFGEMDEPGSGPALATQVVGTVLDQDIQYYLRVDFDGFADLIDDIGGIDVYVDRAFTDTAYPSHGREYAECAAVDMILDEETGEEIEVPNYDCRFEVLHFKEGWTNMDGETALKFVRSRHGNNGEGSDFARSRRQQKVILAVKDKTLSVSTFLNPARISRILNTLEDNIATNLNSWQLVKLAREFKNLDATKMTSHVLDASEDSPLYATTLNGAYVLLPKNDDWNPVQWMAEHIFISKEEILGNVAEAPIKTKPHFVSVEIQNGTNITGLAFKTSQLLDGQGFDVVKVGNAASRGFEHTVIYDLTNGQKPDLLKTLQDFLEADVTLSATGWLASSDIIPKEISVTPENYQSFATEEDIDFLVILGENSENLVRK